MEISAALYSDLFPLSGYVPHGKLLELVESSNPPEPRFHFSYTKVNATEDRGAVRYKKPYTYFASLFCTLCLCPCASLTLSCRISSCSCPRPPLAVTPLSQTGDCSGVTGALGYPS